MHASTALTDEVVNIICSSSHNSFIKFPQHKSSNIKPINSKNSNILKKSSFVGSSLFKLSNEYKISDHLDRNQMMKEENNNRHSLFDSRYPLLEQKYNKDPLFKSTSQGCQKSMFVSHETILNDNKQYASTELAKLRFTYENPIKEEDKLDSSIEGNISSYNNTKRRKSLCNYTTLENNNTFSRRLFLRISEKKLFKKNIEAKFFPISIPCKKYSLSRLSLLTNPIKDYLNKKHLSLLINDLSSSLPKNDNVIKKNSIYEKDFDSVKENLKEKINSKYNNKEFEYIEQIKVKPRSKLLYPSVDNDNYESIMQLPNYKLYTYLNESPSLNIRKRLKNKRYLITPNNRHLNQYLNNLRSESVDSGFSCASISSTTSTASDFSIKASKIFLRRSFSIELLPADCLKISKDEAINYLTWVKSLKKLLQLTKELRSISETEENKEKTMLAEISALQQMKHVRKIFNGKFFI